MTAGAIFHPIGLVAERVRRPVGVSLLLLVGFNTGTNAQLVPEPQGKPAATSSVPATRGQSQSQDGQKPTANTQQNTTQSNARIGEAGNIVRLVGESAQVVMTMSGLTAADKLTGAPLSQFAAIAAPIDTIRLGQAATHTVQISGPQFLGRAGAGSLSWLVTVTAVGLPPGATEKRLARISIGPAKAVETYPLEFTLTNQPPSTGQFDVTAPGHDWFVSRSDDDGDRTYPLMIVNRSEPIAGVRLSQVSLKRSDDGGSIGFDEVKLVQDAKGTASGSIDLQPHETKTVFLRLETSNRLLPYGSFAGQVQLVSSATTPKPVALTARVTSGPVRLAGAALVLLGLLVSLFTTSRLQPRLARLQALRPATLLRDRIVEFSTESKRLLPDDVDGIVAEADGLAARLETTSLDKAGLLPLAISVGGVTGNAANELQTRLNDIAGRLAGLMVLRDNVAALAKEHPRSTRSRPVQIAINDLNREAPKATSATVAQALVATILEELRATPGAESLALGDIPAQVTTQQLDFLLHQTANVAAFIWAAVSLAIGVAYVYSDVDFGTPIDLLSMFLWGLGLTAFGAGIQQLTPRQVATQIGVVVPRSAAREAANP